MRKKKTDIILENVLIEGVAAEGKAIARIDGVVLFVEYAVPGDVVNVKIIKKKKNYMEGFISSMIKPSEQRAFLRAFRNMRRLQMAASPLRNAAPGQTAAGI